MSKIKIIGLKVIDFGEKSRFSKQILAVIIGEEKFILKQFKQKWTISKIASYLQKSYVDQFVREGAYNYKPTIKSEHISAFLVHKGVLKTKKVI